MRSVIAFEGTIEFFLPQATLAPKSSSTARDTPSSEQTRTKAKSKAESTLAVSPLDNEQVCSVRMSKHVTHVHIDLLTICFILSQSSEQRLELDEGCQGVFTLSSEH